MKMRAVLAIAALGIIAGCVVSPADPLPATECTWVYGGDSISAGHWECLRWVNPLNPPPTVVP